LLYPVSKSPCDKAKIPVSFNLVNMPDLVMVKVESIFKFLETVFNTLTEQVVCDDSFGSGVELVGNKDVVTVIIILISFAKDDYKLNGDIAIFKFCLKRIGFM